jgi:hypothetical protein
MDRREPPRIGAGESSIEEAAPAPDGRLRLRRLSSGVAARLWRGRSWGVLALAAGMLVAGTVYLGQLAVRSVVQWLHTQSQYAVPFDHIELIAAPPAWYRGGATGFLDQVRRGADAGDHVPMLEMTPDRLATLFRTSGWVEEVARVTYLPGKIRVKLRYREPVGLVTLADGRQHLGQHLVDERGILLSADDVDPVVLGPLIRITGGDKLTAPADPRPGVPWKSRGGSGDVEEVNESIVAAAGLAAFLERKQRATTPESSPALKVIEIIVTDFDRRGLFMINAERAVIWWQHAPGAERPGEPTAEEKWAMLENWQRTTTERALPDPDYWGFSGTSVVPIRPHRDPAHRPQELGTPRAGSKDVPGKSDSSG